MSGRNRDQITANLPCGEAPELLFAIWCVACFSELVTTTCCESRCFRESRSIDRLSEFRGGTFRVDAELRRDRLFA